MAEAGRPLRRRAFLRLALVLGAAGAAAVAGLRLRRVEPLAGVRRWLAPRLDGAAPTGVLAADEMRTIVALGRVLIPDDETPGARATWVERYVNERTARHPGYLPEYKAAVALLDAAAAQVAPSRPRFHQLTLEQGGEVMEDLFGRRGSASRWWRRVERILPAGQRKQRCWSFVIEDLLSGFYSTPAGWAVVGYDNYPGVPGDPRAYTRPLDSQIRPN